MIGKSETDNEKVCSIVCGAPCGIFTRRVEGFVIAADSGLDRCNEAGILPRLIVGDLDSASAKLPEGVEVLRAKREKDDTDTELAAMTALERGFRELRFFCALGGRLDHSVANIQLLYSLSGRGVKAQLYGADCCAFFAREGTVRVPRFEGYLSVFAYDRPVRITERGMKYRTDDRVFTNSDPFGVSNEITEDFAEITVKDGAALIVAELRG